MITIKAPQGSYFFADFAVLISGMSKHIEETILTASQLKYLISSLEHKRVFASEEDIFLIKKAYDIRRGFVETVVQEPIEVVTISKEDKENKVTEIQVASHTEYPTTSAVVDYVDKVISAYLVKADLEPYATKQEVYLKAKGLEVSDLKAVKVARKAEVISEADSLLLPVHLNNLYQKIENLKNIVPTSEGFEEIIKDLGELQGDLQQVEVLSESLKGEVSSLQTLLAKYSSLESFIGLKIFRKQVYTSETGVWSVDYSEKGFTEPPIVIATGIAIGTGTADKRFASLQKDGVTTTGCKGYLHSSSSAGLLAAMTMVSGEGFVNVIAIGV